MRLAPVVVMLMIGAALPALAQTPASTRSRRSLPVTSVPVAPASTAVPATPAATPAVAMPQAAASSSAAPAVAITIPDAITAPQRTLIHAEVLLDRAHFSPGVIDGEDGSNLKLAVSAYQAANGLPVDGAVSDALITKLTATDTANSVTRYTITLADVAGPFVAKLPSDFAALAKLESPAYSGPVEELAERFHMDEGLLKALNPAADFGKPGTVITVAAINDEKLAATVARIEVDKTRQAVRAYDDSGKLLASYPATVGSTERPAPAGTWAVRAVAPKPDYTFDPKRLTFGKPGMGKLTIRPGPNNPVGSTWIALTKATYGIHGTPDPRLIGKRASHGCVRLTNWDAHQLGASVKAGAKVVFMGVETRG